MSFASPAGGSLGLYRAEYLRDDVYKTFEQPPYWRELSDGGPAFLIGGRGTGKTTSLRNMSFQGQARLHGDDPKEWQSVGIYWRVGTNAVAAFRGQRLAVEEWTRAFSHYVNLELCTKILELVTWRQAQLSQDTRIDFGILQRMLSYLGLGSAKSINSALLALQDASLKFEDDLNAISQSSQLPKTSILGRPIDLLVDALQADSLFASKPLVICIDEYENLEDYQQRVVNTLIKHVGDSNYTFKIGVKTTGIRDRRTLSDEETISEPADYKSVDIVARFSDAAFDKFAERVCSHRLASELIAHPVDMRELFPALAEEEEARLLGIDARLSELRSSLFRDGASKAEMSRFDELDRLSQYLVRFWALSTARKELDCLRDALADPESWDQRRRNYSHAMLFTIRERTGSVFKYYSGWATLTRVAGGNIRYLLQLANEAIRRQQSEDDVDGMASVSARNQTLAVQSVGENAVFDLQSMSPLGGQLTSFVLNLGQVFHVMAREPHGHTPEVTQFRLTGRAHDEVTRGLEKLLREAVVHAALLQVPGDKLAKASIESRELNYALHPIFSGFLGYSSRSKRRMTISVTNATGLALPEGKGAVRRVLSTAGRKVEGADFGRLELFDDEV